MKKIITLVCLTFAIGCGFAQSTIAILDTFKHPVSETVIDLHFAPLGSNNYPVLVTNVSPTISHWDTVYVRRTILAIDAGDATQFCWGGLCYGFTTNVSSLAAAFHPTDTLYSSGMGFHSLISFSAATTIRLVHYEFYDKHNPSDSTGMTLRYSPDLGINELSKSTESVSNAYPNPVSSSSLISYKVSESTQQAKLVFYDVLGKVVKEIVLTNKEGEVKLNSSEFNQGIYFYSLIADDKKIATKKFVVSTK